MIYKKVCFYFSLIAILVLAVIPDSDSFPAIVRLSDKLNHFAAFLVLAVLIDISHPDRRLLWKLYMLLGYGILIEAVQRFIPYREFSIGDLSADLFGLLTYFILRRAREMLKEWWSE